MQNSTFNPQNIDGFTKDNLTFYGQSLLGSSSEGQTTQLDYTLTDDVLITGGMVLVKNAKFGDRVYLKVLHPSYGVVNTFVNGYYCCEDSQKQFEIVLNYPAKLFTGLTIRLEYVSNSVVGSREIAINYFLHKVLT